MANEFKHKDAETVLTRVEDNAVDRHELDSGVEGDFIYWDATNNCFKRTAHPITTVARKTADQTLTPSSTVMQNVTEMLFAVGANEVWEVELVLLNYSATTAPDMKIDFTLPAGATFTGLALHMSTAYTGSHSQVVAGGATSIGAAAVSRVVCTLIGILINSATAGNFQLQASQATATAEDTKVLANSCIIAHRLA